MGSAFKQPRDKCFLCNGMLLIGELERRPLLPHPISAFPGGAGKHASKVVFTLFAGYTFSTNVIFR